jgi:hypothetical protein
MRKKLKVKKALIGSLISDIASKMTGSSSSNSSLPSQWGNLNFTSSQPEDTASTPVSTPTSSKSGLSNFFNRIKSKTKTTTSRPSQWNNLNLSSPTNISTPSVNTTPTYSSNVASPSNVPVMNSGDIQTMSHGGSVEVGKGKDYIKDLI